MARHTFIWTTLPHGIAEDGSLRMAVYLAPRLSDVPAGAALTTFPLWATWPQQVLDALPELEFEVRFRSAAGEAAQPLGRFQPVPELAQEVWPAGWQALFAVATVQPFDGITSIAERPVHSYPAGALNGDLKRRYTRVSAVSVARDDRVQNRRDRNRAGGPLLAAPPVDEPPSPAMQDFMAFQQASAGPGSADSNGHRRQPAAPPEFHETLAWLGSYPELLSRLGLVFELRIPRATLPVAEGELQLQARPLLAGQIWPPPCLPGVACPAEIVHHAPFTVVDAVTFWPRAGDPDDSPPGSVRCGALSTGGLLCPGGDELGAGRMLVSQIDFEGATLKLTSAATQRPAGNDAAADFDAAERALPALRNAGFSLIRSRQADVAKEQARQAEANNSLLATGEPILWSQNISRGYRLDVFEDRIGEWHSLHERDLAYGLEGEPPRELLASEGFMQLAATVAGDEPDASAPGANLLMLETLARWSGWSLTVPRPMAAADPDLSAPPLPAPNPYRWAIEQEVPARSLPRLRYGDIYRFRIRTVDLVGHSPSLKEATQAMNALLFVAAPSWASLPGSPRDHRYLRYEPVAPPVIVPRALGPSGGRVQGQRIGATDIEDVDNVVERLVLRSNGGDASALVYAERFPQWALTNQIHLAPPRTAPATAEAHGLLDDAFDEGTDEACDAVFDLCLQAGDLPAVEPRPELKLPYLPDPLARGVAVRVLGDPEELAGGLGEPITLCRYRAEPAWPNLLPFRLELGEADAYQEPVYDADGRLLTVKLPPGGQVKIALSSFFRRPNDTVVPKDLDTLGIWAWLDDLREQVVVNGVEVDGVTPESALGQALEIMDVRGAKRRAGEGRFWFLTPPQSLILVHALQQPLVPPEFVTLSPARSPGQTSVSLLNEISIHPESTARLALVSAWEEVSDVPPALPRWLPVTDPLGDQRRLTVEAPVREQQILEPQDQGEHPYLWAEDEANPWWTRKSAISLTAGGALEGPGSADEVAIAASGARLAGNPATTPLHHEFGDTRHRQVVYRLRGTSRFQHDFPPPAGVDPEAWASRQGAPFAVNILSSARPVPPVIRRIVPAFLRRTERLAGTLIRHKWGGIRVYLDRPWFTTGDDESLAVVLWGGEGWPLAVGQRAASLSTRWGRDPIWKPTVPADQLLVPTRPLLEHFPLRERFGLGEGDLHGVPNGVTLGRAFQVAAHRVRFNAERNLWFSDIQIDPGDAYFPFVQLALGRFQRHSVGDLHLSEVMLTEFVQIAPYRRVEATLVEGATRLLQIHVSGLVEATTEGPGGLALPPNRVRVQVERRVRGADDLGWLPASLPGPVESDPRDPASDVFWSGRIPLPGLRDDDEMRVLVLEDDFLAADGQQAGEFVPTPRLAYAETITLDEVFAMHP